ncbi:hypothetical protein [Paenibacillus amylolyticus]|uniref:hypothetical protein n=1 Tax=Paenibacillus amylolyticus TaxID=1451 RepID=UPI000B8236D9|nr:hypothetical protein [Paenibacillus amylolyticus]
MIPEPLSNDTLLTLIPQLASQGNIKLSSHAELRINQPDRNFTFERLLFILKHPMSISPEWDEERKRYKYKIQGYNKRHAVVSLIMSNTYIKVVTVF